MFEETNDRVVHKVVAPGSPIFIGTERAGICCFISSGHTRYLLTCGHAFRRGGREEAVYAWDASTVIAHLSRNLMEETSLDAAICELTPRGEELVLEAYQAKVPTFCSMFILNLNKNGDLKDHTLLFWPTHKRSRFSLSTTRGYYPATENFNHRYWDEVEHKQLIQTPMMTKPGDSGSCILLHNTDDQIHLLGLCTGESKDDDRFSYFTFIDVIFDYLIDLTEEDVSLWPA